VLIVTQYLKMIEEMDLIKLVIEVDEELIQKGIEPYQRPLSAYLVILQQRLKISSSVMWDEDPLFKFVEQIYKKLYRFTDLVMPPMHLGAFMFRDVFFPLRIPHIFGSPGINPVDFLDIPERQKQWLFDDQQAGLTFFDQVIDLMDFVYGLDDIEKRGNLPNKTVELWYLGKGQLEASAATLLGSFNKYVVIQNCCLATELLLKGALIAKDVDEKTLKSNSYGHNLKKLVEKIAEKLPGMNTETLAFVVERLPHYVNTRYEAQNFSRLQLGEFLMNTQFVSGEILRQFSNRNCRKDFTAMPNGGWNLTNRTFPKKIIAGY
jgi:HEPN domain-containing protein